MILVTGAGGKTGQAVLRALLARSLSTRALVRRAEQAAKLQALAQQIASPLPSSAPRLEAVVGDVAEASTLEGAAAGADAIYHICPNVHPDEIAIGRATIAAAQAAGVEHFVYHSVLHPQAPSMPHHWNKLYVEAALFESGLRYTILQPASYMQNVLPNWPAVVREGVYAMPYPVETRLGLVDLDDVAEAAAGVLSAPDEHAAATYELAGPQVLTQVEIAEALAGGLGRPVRAAQVPLAEWTERARANGLGPYAIDTLLAMFDYYAQHGFWGNPRALAGLLGRSPATFETFARRVAVRGA
jgi:uncharacterized protein YbjT (DUF2867 family)